MCTLKPVTMGEAAAVGIEKENTTLQVFNYTLSTQSVLFVQCATILYVLYEVSLPYVTGYCNMQQLALAQKPSLCCIQSEIRNFQHYSTVCTDCICFASKETLYCKPTVGHMFSPSFPALNLVVVSKSWDSCTACLYCKVMSCCL